MCALVENYSVDTTIAVICLNPSNLFYRVSDNIREILVKKGFTRLYLLFLFSRIGDFDKICDKPIDDLIGKECDEWIRKIIPDIGKIFIAYGEPTCKRTVNVIDQRWERVRNMILEVRPNTQFLYFGNLSQSGYPKTLSAILLDDAENIY
ncbi:MAG: DUF1643 domain-containing protein [Candidatus Riflebacteria bacterium]|nr:DUF1643 domain-containing protein [Candidatus Riflebacteria bacterium]